jgi:hypothetical protein
MGLSLMNMLGLYQVYISYIQHFIENSSCYKIDESSVSPTTDFFFSKLCYDWQCQQVCLHVKPHLAPKTRFLLLLGSCGFVDVRCPLWWETGSVIYNFRWPSLAHHSQVQVPWDSWLYFTPPSLEGQVPVFISPRNRVTQLYPWPLSSFTLSHTLTDSH